MDIFVDSMSDLAQSINTANKSSELIYKQLMQYLEQTNKAKEQETVIFENISKSLKELNINQFSATSTLEDAINRVSSSISSQHKTIRNLTQLIEENNKLGKGN
jgi:esterase/lipase